MEEILEDNVEYAIAIRFLRMHGKLANVSGSWGEKGLKMGRTKCWCPPLYSVMTNKNPSLSRGGVFARVIDSIDALNAM